MTNSMFSHSPTVIMVAHFLQSLTHRLVLGGELVYHRRPGEEGAILTLAGKYSGMGRDEEEQFWAFLGILVCVLPCSEP
jgi:hypothetical protein